MSKGIWSEDDKSVWAVVFAGLRGIETVMCDTEHSALVIAWFNRSAGGPAQVIELPLTTASVMESKEHDREKFSARGINITRRRRK